MPLAPFPHWPQPRCLGLCWLLPAGGLPMGSADAWWVAMAPCPTHTTPSTWQAPRLWGSHTAQLQEERLPGEVTPHGWRVGPQHWGRS